MPTLLALRPRVVSFATASAVVTLVAEAGRAGYVGELRQILGDAALADGEGVFAAVLEALEAYEQDPAAFYPYGSKYDAWLRGQARLDARELYPMRGGRYQGSLLSLAALAAHGDRRAETARLRREHAVDHTFSAQRCHLGGRSAGAHMTKAPA